MTREEAIKYAEEKLSKGLYRLDLGYLNRGLYQIVAKEVDFMRVAIAALREQPRWISVTERLPEKATIVLCYKDGQRRLGYYLGANYGKGVAAFRHPKDQWAFGVTHWMPLPEPPEVEV